MSSFLYKARDVKGLAITGVIEAENEAVIVSDLSGRGYRVVSIKKQSFLIGNFLKNITKWRKIPQREIILFTRQLAVMLRSGLPITTALSSLMQQIKHEELQRATRGLLEDIKGGEAFSEALKKYPKIFNELYVSMVKVGETAGILAEVLDRIVIIHTQDYELRMRMRSALVYPAILVVAVIGVVSFLLVAIIPKFVVVFETYDAKIPFATQLLLVASNLLARFWYIIIFVVVGSVSWFRKYLKDERNLYHFHNGLLKAPFFGGLYLKFIVARFTRALGTLTKSGVSILEALAVAGNTVGNVVISRAVENMRQAVTRGQSLSQEVEKSKMFPPMVVQMIGVGEKSGKMDQMLTEVAAYYDQEIEYALKNFTTILEPLLLLVMGGMVAFIALSVLLPIFNLIKVFRGGV